MGDLWSGLSIEMQVMQNVYFVICITVSSHYMHGSSKGHSHHSTSSAALVRH